MIRNVMNICSNRHIPHFTARHLEYRKSVCICVCLIVIIFRPILILASWLKSNAWLVKKACLNGFLTHSRESPFVMSLILQKYIALTNNLILEYIFQMCVQTTASSPCYEWSMEFGAISISFSSNFDSIHELRNTEKERQKDRQREIESEKKAISWQRKWTNTLQNASWLICYLFYFVGGDAKLSKSI